MPAVVLLLTLIAPAVDLLGIVQPALTLASVSLVAVAVASAGLLAVWARYPRTSWLAAASLAGCASLALRLIGADGVAAGLSLLSVIALGVGGGFASSSSAAHPDAEAWLT